MLMTRRQKSEVLAVMTNRLKSKRVKRVMRQKTQEIFFKEADEERKAEQFSSQTVIDSQLKNKLTIVENVNHRVLFWFFNPSIQSKSDFSKSAPL